MSQFTRATWKGSIRLELVTIPVKAYSAGRSPRGLRTIHTACGSAVKQPRCCSACSRELAEGEIQKACELGGGQLVPIDEDELATLTPEVERVFEVHAFGSLEDIPLRCLSGKNYLLAPDGPVAARAFKLLEEAVSEGTVALGEIALYGRRTLALLRSDRPALGLYGLCYSQALKTLDGFPVLPTEPSDEERKAFSRLVRGLSQRHLDLERYRDPYADGIERILEHAVERLPEVAPSDGAVVLMEALRESVKSAERATSRRARGKRARKGARA